MVDLVSLNERQYEAVTAPLGPVLVLAGAGSGKTRVLAYRIAYVIDQGLVPAGNILALTFTNKAAKEMQNRVGKLLSGKTVLPRSLSISKSIDLPTMGTFHSIGARLLRKEISVLGYTSSFVIFDTDDTLKIIKEICQELAISTRYSPSVFRSFISTSKNMLQTPDAFDIGLDEPLKSLAQSVYARYQNYLFKQNAVDFDDLLLLPIMVFEARPDILARYRSLFAYILVDEYQDTNPAQYRFLQLLAPKGNIFVVGDDAQSIYGFRGSDIRNILNFEKDYPGVLVVPLEQNYRSTKNILAAAKHVIALNPEQKPKELWTNNDEGEKIKVEEVRDEVAEAELVARSIIRLAGGLGDTEEEYEEEPEAKPFSILDQFIKKAKRPSVYGPLFKLPVTHDSLSEYAVLYRTHAQSRALEEVFIAAGIPYQIVGGTKFYERKEIKDVLAYLRLVATYRDLISVKRVINTPARGVGEKSYQLVKEYMLSYIEANPNSPLPHFIEALGTSNLPPKQLQSVRDFFGLLDAASSHEPETSLATIARWLIKKASIEKYFRDGTETGETRWENVEELISVTTNYDHLPWQQGLQEFLEEVSLFTDIDTIQDEKDAVTFMTLHSAKGLEFDTVFFVGLEEGIMPHSRSLLNPSELAEEIRLAYVGLTRARKRLFLTYARTRTVFGNTQVGVPSRILEVLPHEAIQVKGGAHVGRLSDGEITYETTDF